METRRMAIACYSSCCCPWAADVLSPGLKLEMSANFEKPKLFDLFVFHSFPTFFGSRRVPSILVAHMCTAPAKASQRQLLSDAKSEPITKALLHFARGWHITAKLLHLFWESWQRRHQYWADKTWKDCRHTGGDRHGNGGQWLCPTRICFD